MIKPIMTVILWCGVVACVAANPPPQAASKIDQEVRDHLERRHPNDNQDQSNNGPSRRQFSYLGSSNPAGYTGGNPLFGGLGNINSGLGLPLGAGYSSISGSQSPGFGNFGGAPSPSYPQSTSYSSYPGLGVTQGNPYSGLSSSQSNSGLSYALGGGSSSLRIQINSGTGPNLGSPLGSSINPSGIGAGYGAAHAAVGPGQFSNTGNNVESLYSQYLLGGNSLKSSPYSYYNRYNFEQRPYPVYVPKPYPVYVEKKVPYEVKVPVPHPYEVEKPVPVQVPVHITKPYPVVVEKRVPVPVEKIVPLTLREYVARPYPVPVQVDKYVPVPVKPYYEKHLPVPVEKPYHQPQHQGIQQAYYHPDLQQYYSPYLQSPYDSHYFGEQRHDHNEDRQGEKESSDDEEDTTEGQEEDEELNSEGEDLRSAAEDERRGDSERMDVKRQIQRKTSDENEGLTLTSRNQSNILNQDGIDKVAHDDVGTINRTDVVDTHKYEHNRGNVTEEPKATSTTTQRTEEETSAPTFGTRTMRISPRTSAPFSTTEKIEQKQ